MPCKTDPWLAMGADIWYICRCSDLFRLPPKITKELLLLWDKKTGWDSLWTEGGTNYRWSDSPFGLNISIDSVEKKNIVVIRSEAKPVSRCNGLSGVKVISGGRSWPLHCAQGSCWAGCSVGWRVLNGWMRGMLRKSMLTRQGSDATFQHQDSSCLFYVAPRCTVLPACWLLIPRCSLMFAL